MKSELYLSHHSTTSFLIKLHILTNNSINIQGRIQKKMLHIISLVALWQKKIKTSSRIIKLTELED